VAPPFKAVEFDILFGRGISKAGDLIDVANQLGIVGRSGTYYSFGELRLGQGRDNARRFLDDNPQILEEIDNKVREEMTAKRSANYTGPEIDDEEEPEDE
jgi:recombination protein RecA